jgi:hypothetical protein
MLSEADLEHWAAEPADAEFLVRWACETVEKALAPMLGHYDEIEIFAQGSYANRTAVDGQSDIDVIALWPGLAVHGEVKCEDDVSLRYREFRNGVEDELRANLDPGLRPPRTVCRCEVDGQRIDVLPCLPYRPPETDIWFRRDAMLDGQVSWPRTINALIEERDDTTAGGYRRVVRTLKGMREELWTIQGDEAQSFLIESLVYAAGPAAVRRGKLGTRCVNALRAVTPVLTDEAAGRTLKDPAGRTFIFPEPLGNDSPALDRAQGFVEAALDEMR